jgi:hypothetical protein
MNHEISNEVLQRTPERALPFLRGIGTNAQIRNALAAAGYTEAEHAEGWKLLLAVSGFTPARAPVASVDDAKARAVIAELDAWDESGFRRIHAALGRLHPQVDAVLFDGISSGSGAASVVAISTLLDRLDGFEKGTKAEKAAMATLDKRGIDASERQRLRALIEVAKQAKLPVDFVPPPPENVEQTEKLRELYVWYRDWSETARAVVRRRDHLQLLGLARRKRAKRGAAEEPFAPVPAPASGGASVGPDGGASPSPNAPV